MTSLFANIVFGYQEVCLEVFFSDDGFIVDGDVDSCEDEVFSELCIDAIGRSDKHSEGEQPA